jgi:hypothetical protein
VLVSETGVICGGWRRSALNGLSVILHVETAMDEIGTIFVIYFVIGTIFVIYFKIGTI